jgi:hypothetical protein
MATQKAQPLDFDFDAVHRAVCPDPETLTPGQRANRIWPTALDMLKFLSRLSSIEAYDVRTGSTPVCPAYYQALNNGLLGTPKKSWGNGSAYVCHPLSEKGKAYLRGLLRLLFTPKIEPPCTALMAPRDIIRLKVWQHFVKECAKAPHWAAKRVGVS